MRPTGLCTLTPDARVCGSPMNSTNCFYELFYEPDGLRREPCRPTNGLRARSCTAVDVVACRAEVLGEPLQASTRARDNTVWSCNACRGVNDAGQIRQAVFVG